MQSLEHRIPPPLVALAIAAAMGWAAPHLPRWTEAPDLRLALAIVIGVVALSIDIAALVQFRLARTTMNPLRPENASGLVTSGIYRFTRNPMYVGLVLLLTAWAVYLGSLPALLGVVVFVLFINRFQITPEERVMGERFGAEYAAYRERVRRWV